MNQRKYILATVDRIENNKLVLVAEDGQNFIWPQEKAPVGLIEGSQVKLALFSDREEKEEREEMAKAVLNEILKTD